MEQYNDIWVCHICKCRTSNIHIGRMEPAICQDCHKFINANLYTGDESTLLEASIKNNCSCVLVMHDIINKRRTELQNRRRRAERRRRAGERIKLPRKVDRLLDIRSIERLLVKALAAAELAAMAARADEFVAHTALVVHDMPMHQRLKA
jgi:hypothetical protein